MADSGKTFCNGDGNVGKDLIHDHLGVRIGALFVILVSTAVFTIIPVLSRRVRWLRIPGFLFDFCRYFGSGVIIATAFVHLLEPATDELGQECLNSNFNDYPMAYAFALIAMMVLFAGEFLAYRIGTQIMQRSVGGVPAHVHGHGHGMPPVVLPEHDAHGNEVQGGVDERYQYTSAKEADLEIDRHGNEELLVQKRTSYVAEVVGVMVFELGVVFHSVIIGITLATTPWESEEDDKFYVLFPAIVFHQVFEGLGLGSRLAFLPHAWSIWAIIGFALFYALCTPVGMAIGLGISETFSPDTPQYYYTTGIFDAISAGILIYTGLVELLAHDFIFNNEMHVAPMWKACLNVVEVCAGVGVMALIGLWA